MAQKRYLDFYSPRSTQLLNDRWIDIIGPGIYEGLELVALIDSPTSVRLTPGKLVTNDGVVIEETEELSIPGLFPPSASGFRSNYAIVCQYRWEEYDPDEGEVPVASFLAIEGELTFLSSPVSFDSFTFEDNQILIGYVAIPYGSTRIEQDMIYQPGVARAKLGEFIVGRSPEEEGIYTYSKIGVGGTPPESESMFVLDGIIVGPDYRATEDLHLMTKRDVNDYVGGTSAWIKIGTTIHYPEGPVGINKAEPESGMKFHVVGDVKFEGSLTVTGSLLSASINASLVDSGTLQSARIPNLDAGKVTTGTFAVDRIPNLSADKITSGTFSINRIPGLSAGKITSGIFDIDRIPDLNAEKIISGTLPAGRGTTTGNSVNSFLKYTGHTKQWGCLYGGSTLPDHNPILNYSGYFRATQIFEAAGGNARRVITQQGGNIPFGALSLTGSGATATLTCNYVQANTQVRTPKIILT